MGLITTLPLQKSKPIYYPKHLSLLWIGVKYSKLLPWSLSSLGSQRKVAVLSDRLDASEVVIGKKLAEVYYLGKKKAVVFHCTSIYNLTKANVANFGSFNLFICSHIDYQG